MIYAALSLLFQASLSLAILNEKIVCELDVGKDIYQEPLYERIMGGLEEKTVILARGDDGNWRMEAGRNTHKTDSVKNTKIVERQDPRTPGVTYFEFFQGQSVMWIFVVNEEHKKLTAMFMDDGPVAEFNCDSSIEL